MKSHSECTCACTCGGNFGDFGFPCHTWSCPKAHERRPLETDEEMNERIKCPFFQSLMKERKSPITVSSLKPLTITCTRPHMEWIELIDQKPEINKEVLFYKIKALGGYDIGYYIAFYTTYFGRDMICIKELNSDSSHNELRLLSEFSHWMPLPTLPKED